MTGFVAFDLWDVATQKARDARFLKLALLCDWARSEAAKDFDPIDGAAGDHGAAL